MPATATSPGSGEGRTTCRRSGSLAFPQSGMTVPRARSSRAGARRGNRTALILFGAVPGGGGPPRQFAQRWDAGAASPDAVRLRRVTSGLCVSGSVGSVADDPGMVTFLPAAAARSPAPRQRAQQPGMRRPAADAAVMAALGDLHAAETLGNHRPGKTGERLQDRLGQSVQPAGIGGFRIRCLQLSSLNFHISNIIELSHRTQANTVPTRQPGARQTPFRGNGEPCPAGPRRGNRRAPVPTPVPFRPCELFPSPALPPGAANPLPDLRYLSTPSGARRKMFSPPPPDPGRRRRSSPRGRSRRCSSAPSDSRADPGCPAGSRCRSGTCRGGST